MKKVFLTVLTLGFFTSVMVSCQSEAKKESADTTAVAKVDSAKMVDSLAALPVIEPTKEEVAKAEVKAPDFSNQEVNDGINEFKSLKSAYQAALADNDAEATKAVIGKYNAWVMKAANYGSKLPAEENQKFTTYYEKLIAQWNIVARNAKKK